MINEIIGIIKETFPTTIEITGSTTIKADLELDSFAIIKLICIFEEKYKIDIDEMEILAFRTVDDICNYIASK